MEQSFLRYRLFIILAFTLVLYTGSLLLAYLVRFDFAIPQEYLIRFLQLLPAVLAIKLVVSWFLGVFTGWWRYVSMPDVVQIAKATLLSTLLILAYAVVVHRLHLIPRTVIFLDGVFGFVFVAGVRLITRTIRESFQALHQQVKPEHIRRIFVVGAGEAGHAIARELRLNPHLGMQLVGFIDDDPIKKNTTIQGIPVLGPCRKLNGLIEKHKVDEIIIAIPSATGKQLRTIINFCNESKCLFKVLPGVGELIDGRVTVQQIRQIDLNDLLGRDPIDFDTENVKSYLQGKRVLVTGAGGSIGSEICRQVMRFNPAKLILFENGETPLFMIEQELAKSYQNIPIVPVIGDVRNRSRVNVIFDQQQPQVVFHAAAYKHVPLMEANPAEAVNNNVQGTVLLADASDYYGVEKFVMVSTDKAVRPTNVMGTTKRIAEMYVQSLNNRSKTRFVTTRFGNVLGSNGSVIPTFQLQIEAGGPVTVTHPEVTRFFMTIPEATQLVLQAGSMGQGGEVYLFDMGEPVKITTLAEEMIRLSGLIPYEDIDIVYVGLRPGEKLYEELLLADEGVLPTPHKKICIAQSVTPPHEQLVEQIAQLVNDAKILDFQGVGRGLKQLVPEYTPTQNKKLMSTTNQHP
ncbi:nucleoside-diphosphate sugar epimerase/dehydratase [Pelovirga terrestris]|uniref:Polysaccharide biosynthesis protein n=1 Tax=Pelovirga terrestris TaxID=2771352 RepID=A0A8J6QVP4_9BACT|nr:nucleoside-diphosphate sugar epimerase/dehydratase [Pelovirga terrestris]MBD1399111.1 polysaccharide biosynthesis protein [Pelovirga terrestris]